MSADASLIYELPTVTVRRAVVSAMANNVYLLTHRQGGGQILIDAADDAPAIKVLLGAAERDAPVGTRLELVATTHRHWDHVRALADVVSGTGAPTVAGREDAAGIQSATGVAASRVLEHDEVVEAGGITLHTVHLRGHTPGSMAYVLIDGGTTLIFSGDSLFPGGVGNTENDPQRFASLLGDVQERLFGAYGDDAVVLPGHGGPTTLGAERPALAQWRERGW